MVLYTPLCKNDIFPEELEQDKRKYLTIEGKTIYAEELNDGSYKLLQLMSTNPQDFLNANYSPGTIINISPF